MEARATVLALLLLFIASFCDCQITVQPREEVVERPGIAGLNTFVSTICEVMPINATIEARWILPSGDIVTETSDPDRFQVGPALDLLNVVLLLDQLSYQDAGDYTCEVMDQSEPGAQWIPATVELQLSVALQALESEVNASTTDSEAVLRCEMTDYIRPDESLQWFRGGLQITNGSRHTIVYEDGTPRSALNGGTNRVPGRVSVLTISDPVLTDSGVYTCQIETTTMSANVQLSITEGPTTVPPSTMPPPEDDNSQFPLPAVIGGVAGFLGLIVVVLVAIILIVSLRKRTTSVELLHDNGAYESTNGTGKPMYAKVAKSISPPPPIPARPQNNTMSSMDSEELPSYDVPDVNVKKPLPAMPPHYEDPEISMKYDPYYDTPDEINSSTRIIPPSSKAPKMYYDEVETLQERETKFNSGGYDMRSIPSPAAILSGTLQRQMDQRNPDFAYPSYHDGFSQDDFSVEPDYDQIYSERLDPTMLHNGFHSDTESSDEAIPYSAIYEDPKPLKNTEAPFQVTANNIIEVRKLGTGQFGHVILAKTRGLSLKDMRLSDTDSDRSKTILVAIKKLKPDAESGLMEAFDKEVKFMSRLNHDNVVRLLGVCAGMESFIMMEYMENGDLNQFLQKQKLMPDTISGLQENEVTPIILLYMGVQIASGMHYLASRRFVHRDLATRNCLVGRDFIVKISDFGMSRSLYESAYYRVQGTLVLPIRWMACETFYGKFSVKSDGWAFGVTLWEIYTAGKIDPYDYMTDEEVIADAIRGPDRQILQRPQACPQEVYEIMQRCWVHEPSMRADFGEVYSRLFMIYTRQAL